MSKIVATTCMLVALVAGAARADTLLIDGVESDAQSASTRPRSGMSMTAVESTYGSPAQKHATVGQPPITRWDYPNFSVYFEHEHVIHAVVRR
ncbi:MAG: hypothetical protein ABI640_03685 [Gammaproteobacteria bacterium]